MTARTPTSAPGSSPAPRRAPRGRAAGFTLIELMIVVALVAVSAALIGLAMRDPASTRLEHEAARLAALLESARAESRATGVAVRWVPLPRDAEDHFRFVGLADPGSLPKRWLDPQVRAETAGAQGVTLGPEPLIGAQRLVLRLADQRIELLTDGLGPFVAAAGGTGGTATP